MTLGFIGGRGSIGCGDPGDTIDFSCLFNGAEALSWTPSVASDRTTWAFSGWFKRSSLASSAEMLFTAGPGGGTHYTSISFQNDRFRVNHGSSSHVWNVETSRLFRDPASHMHIYVEYDSNNPTASERVRIWINGERQIQFYAHNAPSLGYQAAVGNATPHYIGRYPNAGGLRSTSYHSQNILVVGSLPGVSAFGYFNSDGHWVPRKYSGPYGTNGFHLEFSDPLNLGKDVSGNGNNFSLDNVTAANQTPDTPTNNALRHDPLNYSMGSGTTFATSEGNATLTFSSSDNLSQVAETFLIPDRGVYYLEWRMDTIADLPRQTRAVVGAAQYIADVHNGYGVAYGDGAVIGALIDVGVGTVEFFKDGVSQGMHPNAIAPGQGIHTNGAKGGKATLLVTTNELIHPPSTNFQTLTSQGLPCPAILNPHEYVTTRERVAGAGVSDVWDMTVHKSLVLSKRTDAASDWRAVDTVLGAGKAWATNDAADGVVDEPDGITAFTDNGFSVGANAAYQGTRKDYLFRASPKSGFDIVTVNHTGGTTTVPHNAGGMIEYAWVVRTDGGGDRRLYHHSLPAGDYLRLNSNAVAANDPGWFTSTANDVTIGGSLPAGQYQLYLWRGVPQFSQFSSHIGNGNADGPKRPTDFAPRLLFCRKAAGGESNWVQEAGANPVTTMRYMSGTTGEYSHPTGYSVDFLSNGLKWRTSDSSWNASGVKFIAAIWADQPIKFARAQ